MRGYYNHQPTAVEKISHSFLLASFSKEFNLSIQIPERLEGQHKRPKRAVARGRGQEGREGEEGKEKGVKKTENVQNMEQLRKNYEQITTKSHKKWTCSLSLSLFIFVHFFFR